MNNASENKTYDVTLAYMTNPQYRGDSRCNEDTINTELYKEFKKDKRFYRKRIMSSTRELFRKNDFPQNIKDIHTKYITSIIDHLKNEDRKDILQEEYIGMDNGPTHGEIDEGFNIGNANKSLYNIKEPTSTLDKYVTTHGLSFVEPIIPKKKTINLRNPKLKTKGIIQKPRDVVKKSKE